MTAAAAHVHAPAGVMAYLDGEPVPRRLLEERLSTLRASDAACVLPAPDTREGRQLVRWVAQVVLVELVCRRELAETDAMPTTAEPLDVSAAVAVGSITAAALAGSAAVRQLAEQVTAHVRIEPAQLAYAAEVLGVPAPAVQTPAVELWHRELVNGARLEAFARWLNAAMHQRVTLVHGLEHPGDSSQPDNLHRH